jgi:hypothetical protein
MSRHKKSRDEQLVRARRIRSKMSKQWRLMKQGELHVADVLQDPYMYSLGRSQVFTLLRRAPGLSDKGAKKICLQEKVWPMDRVRDLDQFIREEIIKALPPRARKKT